MSKFNVETLEEALDRIGNLDNRDFLLGMWVGVDQECKARVRIIRLSLPRKLSHDIAKQIIMGINSKVLILFIIDEHQNIYTILEAERFATKPCDKGKEKKKGSDSE
jgi:bifunctional DNase/RNase